MNNNDFVNYPTKAYLGATNVNSGATHIGVNPIGNLASNNVQDALQEIQRDIDMVTGGENLIYSMDDAYEDGGTVYVDQGDIDFSLNGQSFRVSDSAGSAASATYMNVNVGGDKAVSSATGLTATGIYYFKVNDTEYHITIDSDTTYSAVLTLLNLTTPSYRWSLTSGNLRCQLKTLGANPLALAHAVSTPDLFNTLSGFTGFGVQNLGSSAVQGATIFEVQSNSTTSSIKAYKSVLPQGTIDLGSSTNKWGNIWASSAHFDTNTVYFGSNNIISVQNGKLSLSNDAGTTVGEIAKINVPGAPVALASVSDQNFTVTTTGLGTVTLQSDNEIFVNSPLTKFNADVEIDGNIIPSLNSTSSIGSETKRLAAVYTNSIYFRPIAESTDYAKISTEVADAGTIVHHQIGRESDDQIVFESNNGTTVSPLLTIDGSGTVTVPGNLVVSGTTTTINSTNTTLKDAAFIIKYNNIGIDGDSSIVVRRAKSLIEGDRDAKISWSDTTHRWTATYGVDGATTDNIIVTGDLGGATFTQTNATSLTSVFNYNAQTSFNWSTRDTGQSSITSIVGALNATKHDLWEYVELIDTKGAAVGVAAGANLVGAKGIAGIIPTGKTAGADGSVQQMIEGLSSALMTTVGSTTIGSVKYNGTTRLDGSFDGGTTAPNSSTRLNYNGNFFANSITAIGNLAVTGTSQTAGAFDASSSNPTATTRLNYNGNLFANSITAVGNLAVTGTSQTAGAFDASSSNPTATTRLNYNGNLFANSITAVGNIKINGTTQVAGAFDASSTAPTDTTRLNYNGYLYATRVYNAVWNDLAEFMQTASYSEAGDVMVMTSDGVKKSSRRAQKAVVGVHSDTFGYALGAEDQENKTPIGLTGRVNVKVREPLEIGDLLVSDEDGFASKATSSEELIPGIVIGKVMEDKNNSMVSRVSMLILNR